jgi:hypothetical protein
MPVVGSVGIEKGMVSIWRHRTGEIMKARGGPIWFLSWEMASE